MAITIYLAIHATVIAYSNSSKGSSEWKLLRCDTEYLFNRNYPGSESAKMDEAFNYLYVIPKSW